MEIAKPGLLTSRPSIPAAVLPLHSDAESSEAASPVYTKRPTSAGRTRPPSALAPSRVHQKLRAALQSADSQASTLQASFRARGVASAAAAERELADRSVSRYRSDAAIVSFADASPSCSFCYSANFMPGVHFYTFLASKDSSMGASSSTTTSSSPPELGATTASAAPAAEQADAVDQHRSTPAKKPGGGLQMWIPDTVVYGETGRAVLLYTDDRGFVQRSTDVTDKLVVERLVPTNGSELQPVVVCKEPTTTTARKESDASAGLSYQGNLLRLLSPGELKTVLSNVSSTRSTKSFALQKFIRCNGSKAFIVRAVYEAGKPAYAWMVNNTTPMVTPTPTVSQVLLSLGQEAGTNAASSLISRSSSVVVSSGPRSSSVVAASSPSRSNSVVGTSTGNNTFDPTPVDAVAAAPPPLTTVNVPLVNRVCTSIQVDKACTFIKLSERGCAAVAELNQRLVKYIEQRLHLQLQTLVADFVKDADGKWWLLQVKHFRVKSMKATKPYSSLPRRLRMQYLGYRDSSLIDETTESDEENDLERQLAHLAAQQAQRQVLKLTQCKCCLAAYPKAELSFKMTLKMINEMLVRLRSRLPPEKSYTFLTSALAREPPDASLAYESWSVCSYCYAIYERDQQLQNVEAKFGGVLGVPDPKTALAGLGKLDDRSQVVDPTASSTVLPAQLTLCRLMLVINGIYDIPPELYDAEKDPVEILAGSGAQPTRMRTVSSRLYLRISALGYTECIPVDPADIVFTNDQAPRGTRQRQASSSTAFPENGDDDDDGSDGDSVRSPRSARSTTAPSSRAKPPPGKRNYWLPVNLIRTVTFFSPRTPLHAKLKETSGLMPFLNEDNSISIQFIRATEPPLHDLTLSAAPTTAERPRTQTRRSALRPSQKKPATATVHKGNHSILLGATKIRMAQFRSAYVTKLDFYACMALRGEMFNVKGNIGLERVRYVDTKLLTSQYRLRVYNGVYIPDASYIPCDPLTSEWMDCLRAMINPHAVDNGKASADGNTEKNAESPKARQASPRSSQRPNDTIRRTTSTTSLGAGGEEMDEELEEMIERASHDRQTSSSPKPANGKPQAAASTGQTPRHEPMVDAPSTTSSKPPTKLSLLPTATAPSRFDSQMSMLLQKPVLSPRGNNAATPPFSTPEDRASSSVSARCLLWSLTIQLNNAHHLQTRERPFCRWECYYELLGQRRSAVERPSRTNSDSPTASDTVMPAPQITFNCTHRFYFVATASMLHEHFRTNRIVPLNLRNDVYSSTRSRATGEFNCRLDLSELMAAKRFDRTLDIQATASAPDLTPREAAVVSRSPPFLSVSVQLAELAMDPSDVVSNGDFVVVGATGEGIHVLKKIM